MSTAARPIARASVSVVLIRENAEQLTGGGCCGALSDDDPTVRQQNVFAEARRTQQQIGLLHRAVCRCFAQQRMSGKLEVTIVDPRNQLYLVGKLLRDVWRYRPGWRAGAATVLQLFALPAVVVNGRVISRRGTPLDPDSLCHEVSRLLDGAWDGASSYDDA